MGSYRMIILEVIKQQCYSFESLGAYAEYKIYRSRLSIFIAINKKIYKFSDPDLNVVSMQLSKLFLFLKGKKNNQSKNDSHSMG